MKKQKLGFTLVELLAVIVILAVIALIATPQILRLIENSRKEAFKDTAYGIIESAEQRYTKDAVGDNSNQEIQYVFPNGSNISKLDIKGDLPQGGYLKVDNKGQMELLIHNNKYCAKKEKDSDDVIVTKYDKETCKTNYQEAILNGADPELQRGMIPITFSNNKPVKADPTKKWYSYENKEWANVVLVKQEKREEYQNASEGKDIASGDILGYLVWIPRFRYKLFNASMTAGNNPSTIDIVFESSSKGRSNGTSNGEYYTPKGFTFGNEEINGFWMGKFETTGSGNNPTILPNVSSLRSQNVSTQFDTGRKFNNENIYGISGDAHMSKNTEWGIVPYLSHSKYGTNKEIRINNNNGYRTGCGANTESAASSGTCDIAYGETSAYPQSTTGNITGVFDMSGGAWEYQMSVLADNEKKPYSGRNNLYNSGYNGKFSSPGSDTSDASITALTTGKSYPNPKYYDLYQTTNSTTACNGSKCLGQSLNETVNWYGDYYSFVSPSSPWLLRGGYHSHTTAAGGFSFSVHIGGSYSNCSFRVVVVS